jgi:hypothetical protein
MLVLRCTTRLLKRLRVAPAPITPASTTRLGDWYANLLHLGRRQLVLAVSERTFLPVLIPAAPASSIVERFRDECAEVLRAIGVPEQAVRHETTAMTSVIVSRTTNRQVVGIMVEFARVLEYTAESYACEREASLRLAGMVCLPLRPEPFPNEVTKTLFAASATLDSS